MRGGGVDVEREDLVAQDPAVGAVGELDPEPVVMGGPPDGRQHLVELGAVDDPEAEPRTGVDLRLFGDHPHERGVVGARLDGGQQDDRQAGAPHRAHAHGEVIHPRGR